MRQQSLSIMQVVLKKKSTTEITLFSVGWYLNIYRNYIVFCRMVFKYSWVFFSLKKYALKNIVIHVMCIFTKNIMTHKGKEWNKYLFLQNN